MKGVEEVIKLVVPLKMLNQKVNDLFSTEFSTE